jgi:glycosyltransferase involved in cell wall biosynthesis
MPPARAFDLLYFSSIDWGYTWQRPQQLASRLAKRGRVLYVEPLGLRRVRTSDLPRLLGRLAERACPPTEGVSLCRAPLAYFPFPGWPLADRINGRLLRRRIARWMREAASCEPIVWMGVPSQAALEAARGIRASRVVYDCLDRFDLFHDGGSAIAHVEEAIATRADLVFATSADLFDRMRVLNPRTSLLPNAVDYDHFARAATTLPAPPALARLSRPIVGYVGEIAPWFDVEAVAELAASHPAWSLVLLGPLHSPAAPPLLALRNVHHLGRVGYDELPHYVGHFDACLLPFKVNPLTQAASPVKLYEYLASGKPVASTPLKEVLPLRGLVEIAEEGRLGAAVEACLASAHDTGAASRRMAMARDNTWDKRVERALVLLLGG